MAYGFGPAGLAAAGLLASSIGVRYVLAFGAAWRLASTAVALALPALRRPTAGGPGAPESSAEPANA